MITPKFNIWLKCAAIRAVRTLSQTAIATIGTAVVLKDVDWIMVLSASLLAGILSILTSIATGLPEADAEAKDNEIREAKRLNGQEEEK